MTDDPIYSEHVSSTRSALFFVGLTALFALLAIWRVNARGLDVLAGVLFCLSAMFLFYTINFRTLDITLSAGALNLTFGLFRWRVPLDNIADCRLDSVALLMYYGGAGIHFMMIRGRYRASFNFLEYPRVVITLRRKAGLVQDISFSTRHPDDVVRLIRETGERIRESRNE